VIGYFGRYGRTVTSVPSRFSALSNRVIVVTIVTLLNPAEQATTQTCQSASLRLLHPKAHILIVTSSVGLLLQPDSNIESIRLTGTTAHLQHYDLATNHNAEPRWQTTVSRPLR
jgi:hypothetical protein